MLPDSSDATQTESKARTIPTAWGSASSALTRFAVGSIRATTWVQSAPADQTASSVTATKPQGMKLSLMVAVTLFVRGLTRTMLLPEGRATQTASPLAVTPMCGEQQALSGPTRIVATIRLVAGSIRVTLGPRASAIQTAPGETATPEGCPGTWIVALTLFVVGSIRETVSSRGWEIQTAPPPAAASSPGETLILAMIAFRRGSIRISVDVVSLSAQTAPSPAVNGPPSAGTGMFATTLPAGGSGRMFGVAVPAAVAGIGAGTAFVGPALTLVTIFEAKLLTQTEPPAGVTVSPDAAPAGRATRIGGPAAFPERTSILLTIPRAASPTNR